MAILTDLPFHTIKLWRQTDKEYIYFCPFCNERSTHGHLYISRRFPVYYCFKCNASGNLNRLSKFINEQCNIEYNNTIEYNLPYLDIPKILDETNELLKLYSLAITNEEKEYFRRRTKLKTINMNTIVKFSLFPNSYARNILINSNSSIKYDNTLRTWTLRGFGTGLSGRAHNFINDNCFRYINGNIDTPWNAFISNDSYFIRSNLISNYNSNRPANRLVIAEGVYDICAIYLNRKKYDIDDRDSVFTAVQCSNYNRAVKLFQLLYNCFPKNITVFADIDIKANELKKQFIDVCNNSKVKLNWPTFKDWEDAGPVKFFVEI